jgi:endonuclease G, mitochondrial
MLVPLELLEKAEGEFAKSPGQIAAIRKRNAAASAVALDGEARVARRLAMLAAVAPESLDIAFERYIGDRDLLPINYLLRGAQQARAVGCIRYFDKRLRRPASATGFMVSPDLLLTNRHVFPVADLAGFTALVDDATIQFGNEFDLQGRMRDVVVHDLDPATFFHAFEPLDFALVAVSRTDRSGRHALREHGFLVLNGTLGKAGMGDYATIIQHPDGEAKQIALRNNEIIDLEHPDAVVYQSDTAPGSSGAPVFNNEWQVIALHSAGVPKKNEAGQFLDKDDQVIEPVGDRIDERRVVWLSNRGIRVSAIMRQLREAAPAIALHPMVQVLFSPSYTDTPMFAPAESVPTGIDASRPAPVRTAPVPPATPPISVHISVGGTAPGVVVTTDAAPARAAATALELEKKLEDEMDYSRCAGYEDDFMGVRIPMPTPSPTLRKQLAFRSDHPNAFTLKYHHYSVLHHAVRRVPALSAINVHGKYRYAELGKGTRKDNWVRDNRIDYDVQLDDAWYAHSGFDKGHLARREDAEWGTTAANAKLAADLTCSYANAIPQVPALNRAIFGHRGVWGQLEAKLLEAGVTGEEGRSARICVFNGPIFDADDPVFKGVQVALRCFKVVAWFDGTGTLRTTCFRLTQEELVDDIEFEVPRFDEVFRTWQVSLAGIEDATGLRFPPILRDADTYDEGGDGSLVDEAALERLVRRVAGKRGSARKAGGGSPRA